MSEDLQNKSKSEIDLQVLLKETEQNPNWDIFMKEELINRMLELDELHEMDYMEFENSLLRMNV